MKADVDKPETLEAALEGAYGTFLVTNFMAHKDPEREIKQVGFRVHDLSTSIRARFACQK